MDSLKFSFADKMKFMRFAAGEESYEPFKITDDTGWVLKPGRDLFERVIKFTDGPGFYYFTLTSSNPQVDPGYAWEKMPDEIKPYSGHVKQPKEREFKITVQRAVLYDYYRVFATDQKEAKRQVEEFEVDSYDSDSDECNQIVRITEI